MKASIEGIRGRYAGRKVALPKARIDIGRDDQNSMAIPEDTLLSRRHVCIFSRDEWWYCADLGSTNGTFLNGERIGSQPELIPDGGIVACGQQEFRVTYEQTILDKVRSVVFSIPKPPVVRPPQFNLPASAKPRDLQPSENKWYGPGTSVQIHGCLLSSPMVYVGEKGAEPSLIIPKLPVLHGTPDSEVPYWPTYRDLKPVQRWNYLKWLERGRTGRVDSGFLFIFFYGIERRLMGEEASQVSLDERRAIMRELELLCSRYPRELSFHGYCRRLELGQWPVDPDSIRFTSPFEQFPSQDDAVDILGMSCLALHKKPFTKTHALEWFQTERRFNGKVAATRCAAEADYLFSLRAEQIVGDGVHFAPGKSKISTSYQAANKSIRLVSTSIPRALETTKLLDRLKTLATACLDELTPAAKAIGPDPKPFSKNRAALLFPADLVHQSETGQKLLRILEEASKLGFLPSLDQLQDQLGLGEEPLKKLENALFEMCASLGFVVEPDPRFMVLPASKVARFAVQRSGHQSVCTPSPRTSQALRLALIAKSILQTSLASQQRQMHSLIETAFELAAPESERLEVFLRWLAQSEAKIVKSTALAIEDQDRAKSAQILIQIVQSSGEITPSMVKALSQILTLWGWDETAVYRSIHNDEPALIIQETERLGFSIPAPQSKTEERKPLLNAEKLRELELQTQEVSGMLREVFESEDTDGGHKDLEVSTSKEQMLLDCIGQLVPGQVSRERISELAIRTGLPLAAFIESINEVAIETCGYPLIIEDGDFEIEPDILAELQHE